MEFLITPGNQGFHGLKGKVDNRFIILAQGGHQIFKTYVYASEDGLYQMIQEGEVPDYCYLDEKPVKQEIVTMKKRLASTYTCLCQYA